MMTYRKKVKCGLAASLLPISLLITAPQAMADNIANCEIVLMETIEDENGNGGAQVASYRPAGDFIASVYSDEDEVIQDIDGLALRALLCSRKNVIISDADFKLLATGVPFILSQNFDSAKSDLLTYFFKDGQFRYTHKGEELSEENLAILTERFEDFNSREDVIKTLDAARKARKAKAEAEAEKVTADKSADDEALKSSPEGLSENTINIVEIEPEAISSVKLADDTSLDVVVDILPETALEAEALMPEVEIVELKTIIEETVTKTLNVDEDIPKIELKENTAEQDDN